jgi:gas vesicle protein
MEKSEEIFKKLEELGATRDRVEKNWMMFNNSPELRSLVEELIVRERTGPVEEIHRLQGELKEKLAARDQEKDGWLKEWGRLRNELFKLSQPAIIECLREISDEITKIQSKRTSEILSKRYLGVSKTIMLRVKSNSEAVKEAEKFAKEATARIQEMHFSSISMIQDEGKVALEKIRAIDITAMTEREVSEEIYFRGSKSPGGISPSTMGYDGPLSGLKM